MERRREEMKEKSCEIIVRVYKNEELELAQRIEFPLTDKAIKKALQMAENIFERAKIKPLVIPKPSAEKERDSVVPEWIIDQLNTSYVINTLSDVGKDEINAVLKAMFNKGFIVYEEDKGGGNEEELDDIEE